MAGKRGRSAKGPRRRPTAVPGTRPQPAPPRTPEELNGVPWAEWTEPERERFGELVNQLFSADSLWYWGPEQRGSVDEGAPPREFLAAQTRARAERPRRAQQAIETARLSTVIGGERVTIPLPKDHPQYDALRLEIAEATALPADAAKRTGKPGGAPRKLAEREKVRKLHAVKPGLSIVQLAKECGVSRDLVADALRPKTDKLAPRKSPRQDF